MEGTVGSNRTPSNLRFFTATDAAPSVITERMRIDSTGAVTKATSPAFAAKSNAVLNVTGDSTAYTGLFADTEVFDRGGDFNTSNSTFTAPVAGIYRLTYVMSVSGVLGTHTDCRVTIHTSDIDYAVMIDNCGAYTAATFIRKTFTVLADMDAADTATILIAFSGGTKVVDWNAAQYFMGELVA